MVKIRPLKQTVWLGRITWSVDNPVNKTSTIRKLFDWYVLSILECIIETMSESNYWARSLANLWLSERGQ